MGVTLFERFSPEYALCSAFEDMLVGTMEMTMIKEDKIWKIDGIAMPKFDKFTMSKNKDQASE